MIKGRKCNVSADEFVVKISNRFAVLAKDEEDIIAQDTFHSPKVTGGNFKPNSLEDVGFAKSTTIGKASEMKEKCFHPNSSFRRSKQQSTAQKQSLFNYSSEEQGCTVKVRKLSRKKFSQQGFQFKKVEIINDDTLVQFETPNPFKLLDTTNEEYLKHTDSKVNTISLPKHLLKKCRYCNYKKRSCTMSSSSCASQIKKCFRCGKGGHYPQSMCCQANKVSQVKP